MYGASCNITKQRTICDASIPLLALHPDIIIIRNTCHLYVHSSAIRTSADIHSTQMSINRKMNIMDYIHTKKYYSADKKNENIPSAAARMD